MAADVAAEYEDVIDVDGEEFVETKGAGGDFAPIHDFVKEPKLIAFYVGAEEKDTKHGKSLLHTFTLDSGDETTAWGTAILNSRIDGLAGNRVLVHKTGDKIPTKNKPAWEFKVYAARSALANQAF